MPSASHSSSPLLIVCFCAQWCGTCRVYQETFRRLATRFEMHHFFWVDVEDQADLVDPIDVVDFPTILLVRGKTPLFFGPLTPQAETLSRLVRAHADVPIDKATFNASTAVLTLVEKILTVSGQRDAPLLNAQRQKG